MRPFEFSRCAFGITVAVASLSACGGASMPRAFVNTISDVGALKHNQTFHYTGKKQTFIVPAGVSQLTVVAHGGEGAGFNISPSTDTPGFPGRVRAIIPYTPAIRSTFLSVGLVRTAASTAAAPAVPVDPGATPATRAAARRTYAPVAIS